MDLQSQSVSLRANAAQSRYARWIAASGGVLLAMTLTSCAAPVTQRPVYSDAEFKAEQEAQAAAVKAAQQGNFDDQKDYTPEQVQQFAVRLGPIASRVEKASESLCADIGGKQCQFAVILDPTEKGLNAHADGQNVVIYPAMVDYATNDNQLAFVIAHEFAHSIMGHVKSQQKNVAIGGILGTLGDALAQSQGLNTQGQLGKFGAQTALLRYSPAFENEADYIGLYILARAGYVLEDAPGFWRLMSLQAPQAVYSSSTHPNNPSRTVAMQKAVAEIRAKQQAGQQPLLPNLAPRS